MLLYAKHVNSFNHCFWKLRLWAPTGTYGNEKPERGDQRLNNTFRRSASVVGTPTKLPISFSLLNTWLADSEHELVSFLSLLQVSFSWRTTFPLAFYNYKLIHFSSHSSDNHGTQNSNYRRNNSNRNASRNTWRVSSSQHVWSSFSQCHYDSWIATSISKSGIQRGFPIVLARFAYCNWSVALVT